MEIKEKIIEYIKHNRVSATEVADCLDKSGAIDGVMPLNSGHFAVGEIQYTYAVQDSNWSVHESLAKEPVSDKIIFVDAVDVHGRAVIGDIISKYALLYMGNKGIVCTGKVRDAHILIKENYPIWCKGVSPVGCFKTPITTIEFADEIEKQKDFYQGAIAVCDDSGVVVIPKEKITEDFYHRLEHIEEQEDIWHDCIDRRKWNTFQTVCLEEYLK